MRTIYLAGIAIAATAFLSACTSEETPTATQTPAPNASSPAATNPGATPKAAPKDAANKKDAFKTSFIPGKGNTGLIPPTDKTAQQEKLNKTNTPQINTNRDPFAPLPGTIPPLVFPDKKPRIPVTNIRPVVRVEKPVYIPPEPTEAMAVSVSGVVDMAGTQYAILSIPGEATTRYVKAGQRIANNQVLVKRIDTFGTPSVVLQQYGIEVVRSVGQPVAAAPATSNETPANAAPTNPTNAVPANPADNPFPPKSSNNSNPVPPGVIVPPSGSFVPNTLRGR